MVTRSKSGLVETFLINAARRAIADIIADTSDEDLAQKLKANKVYIANRIAFTVSHDDYRMLELHDIFEWRKTSSKR